MRPGMGLVVASLTLGAGLARAAVNIPGEQVVTLAENDPSPIGDPYEYTVE